MSGILIYLFYGGIYYENSDDIVLQSFIFGYYNGGSNALPDTFGCFMLLSHLFNHLNHIYPGVNWYDAFQLFILIICLILLARGWFSSSALSGISVVIFNVISFAVIAGVFIKPAEFTKTALFLSGIVLAELYNGKKKSNTTTIFLALCFFTALLIRIESAVLSLILVALFALANSDKHLYWVKASILPALLVLLVSLIANIPKDPQEDYYLKIRPYEYTITDFDRNNSDVQLSSKEDSVIFRSCVHFFFADSSKCNIDFFNRIGLSANDKSPIPLLKRLFSFQFHANKIKDLKIILLDLKYLIIIWLLSCILISSNKIFLARRLSANFAGFIIIIAISLILKPEAHVIAPVLGFMALLNFIRHRQDSIHLQKKRILYLAITLIMLCEAGRQWNRVNLEVEKDLYYSGLSDQLTDIRYQNLILNIGTWDNLHIKLFSENLMSSLKRTYVLDGAILYFNNSYQQMMQEVTGEKSFIGHWDFFIDTPGTLFVSSESRLKMQLEHLNVLYNKNYTAIQTLDLGSPGSGKENVGLFIVTSTQ